MTISAEFIDQIVRNVMREIQPCVSPIDSAPQLTTSSVKEDANSKSLPVPGLVISEDILNRSNAAGRTISLQPGAIITPSGRDFIRKKGICVAAETSSHGPAVGAGTFIAVGSGSGLTTAASAAGWRTVTAATEFQAASLASEKLSSGIVTCFGGEPSVIACLLNRNASVRTAVVTRSTNLITLTTVMNPHVVCLEASGWSFGELLRLLKGLTVSAVTPVSWKELNAGGKR